MHDGAARDRTSRSDRFAPTPQNDELLRLREAQTSGARLAVLGGPAIRTVATEGRQTERQNPVGSKSSSLRAATPDEAT